MKNVNYIINGILAVAVIVLFILHFSGRKGTQSSNHNLFKSDSTNALLPIAYIRTDSLLANYKLFQVLNEASMKDMENHQLDLNQRKQKFEKDAQDFQQKVQQNIFLTQERINQEGSRLEKMRTDLENYAAQIQQNLADKNAQMQRQLQDSVINGLKAFNNPQKYQMIFSNIGTDNFYYIDDAYDITKDVIDFLNARYTSKE